MDQIPHFRFCTGGEWLVPVGASDVVMQRKTSFTVLGIVPNRERFGKGCSSLILGFSLQVALRSGCAWDAQVWMLLGSWRHCGTHGEKEMTSQLRKRLWIALKCTGKFSSWPLLLVEKLAFLAVVPGALGGWLGTLTYMDDVVVLNVDGNNIQNPGASGFGGVIRSRQGVRLVGFFWLPWPR